MRKAENPFSLSSSLNVLSFIQIEINDFFVIWMIWNCIEWLDEFSFRLDNRSIRAMMTNLNDERLLLVCCHRRIKQFRFSAEAKKQIFSIDNGLEERNATN